MIKYSATKEGIVMTIPDTQKERYENLGYKCEIYMPPNQNNIQTATTKKTKGEQ